MAWWRSIPKTKPCWAWWTGRMDQPRSNGRSRSKPRIDPLDQCLGGCGGFARRHRPADHRRRPGERHLCAVCPPADGRRLNRAHGAEPQSRRRCAAVRCTESMHRRSGAPSAPLRRRCRRFGRARRRRRGQGRGSLHPQAAIAPRRMPLR